MILLIKEAKLCVWFFYINSTYFLLLTLREIEKINKHISEINIYIYMSGIVLIFSNKVTTSKTTDIIDTNT